MTFHALCSRYLHPARDDYQMKKVIQRVRSGELVARATPKFRKVLIDEAQDVRLLYIELLEVMGFLNGGIEFWIAGDFNQLVYDFDSDFPACLDLLQAPWSLLNVAQTEWTIRTLDESRRLTKPMCEFVNVMFGTNIHSGKDGPPVTVIGPKSTANMTEMIIDVIKRVNGRVLLLVDRKRGNRNLRHLLNTLSMQSMSVNIHGIDAPDENAKIVCGSFWSCKGLEEDVVIVFLPEMASRNPTYVALTRAREKLVVVLDPKEPHAVACNAVMELGIPFEGTAKVLQNGIRGSVQDSFQRRGMMSASFKNLDNVEYTRSVVEKSCTFTVLEEGLEDEDETLMVTVTDRTKDISAVIPSICLAKAESRTGIIRVVNDVLNPTRLDFDKYQHAIKAGLVSRWVPRFVTSESLLADDLRECCIKAHENKPWSDESIAVMSLAGLAWDSFDTQMRSLMPVTWMEDERIRLLCNFLTELIPANASYDVRMSAENRHVRYHAYTDTTCFHVVWIASSTDVNHACSRAALHPSSTCRLVEMCSFRVTEISVTNKGALFDSMS